MMLDYNVHAVEIKNNNNNNNSSSSKSPKIFPLLYSFFSKPRREVLYQFHSAGVIYVLLPIIPCFLLIYSHQMNMIHNVVCDWLRALRY